MQKSPKIFLSDNGSLRPEATLALRGLANSLSERLDQLVEPVSVLHSHKIDPAKIGGQKARIFNPALNRAIEAGESRFVVLPLFLGPSLAITSYLPELIEKARVKKNTNLNVVISDPLAGPAVDVPDLRLAEMMAENVLKTIESEKMSCPAVALVDHGTPIRPVNQLRNAVAEQLAEQLGDSVSHVFATSMERRDGPEYAFNEPLLETIDQVEGFCGPDLVAAMFFLLPGRHAGAGGDVAEICDGVIERGAVNRIAMTPLLGSNQKLLDILEDRARDALAQLN
ncbi:MAG: CbiX/SirB N-terminal domain-containing protein [Verrucomicrobiota bacterium]